MKVTVGITNYNYKRFLRKSIESALSQADEVIVVDDGSTDGSQDIIASYPSVIPILHKENTGTLVTGRREVLERATGDYVMHLDADDYLLPACLKTYKSFMSPDTDWAWCNLLVVDENHRVVTVWDYSGFPKDKEAAIAYAKERLTTPINLKGLLRVKWLRENDLSWYHFGSTYFGDDCLTCLKYLEADPHLTYVPMQLLAYRKHKGQMTDDGIERRRFRTELYDYFEGE